MYNLCVHTTDISKNSAHTILWTYYIIYHIYTSLSYRDEYTLLLKLCMLLCDGKGFTDAGLPLALRQMLKQMKEDIGMADASSVAISSVLPLASNQAQAERMWSNLVTVSGEESTE